MIPVRWFICVAVVDNRRTDSGCNGMRIKFVEDLVRIALRAKQIVTLGHKRFLHLDLYTLNFFNQFPSKCLHSLHEPIHNEQNSMLDDLHVSSICYHATVRECQLPHPVS